MQEPFNRGRGAVNRAHSRPQICSYIMSTVRRYPRQTDLNIYLLNSFTTLSFYSVDSTWQEKRRRIRTSCEEHEGPQNKCNFNGIDHEADYR